MAQDENRLTLLRDIVKREEDRDTNQVARAARLNETGKGLSVLGLQPGTTAAREHESLRRALEADVNAFVAGGGQVERLEQMDKFEMTAPPGYAIVYGAKDGRRQKHRGHG